MANWEDLKNIIAENIKANDNQEITGNLLQGVLNAIVNTVEEDLKAVDILELDTLVSSQNLLPSLQNTSYFTVTATLQGLKMSVGKLIMFTDSMRHGITQVLVSNYNKLDAEGNLNTDSHNHTRIFIYSRFWSLQSRTWSSWQDSLQGPIVDLGSFDSAGEAEEAAAEYASNKNVVFMFYTLPGADGRSGIFMQSFSNTSGTVQFHYLGGRRYARQVSWAIGSVGAWSDITGCERFRTLVWDEASSSIKVRDALGDGDWGGARIPLPTPQQAGADVTAENKQYIYKGERVSAGNTSTDVVADLNIQTQNNAVQIVSKSWGTNSWNVRATIKPATSSAAGVMSAAQCTQHERVASFLAKLETAFGTDDLDTIVNKLASLK